jgi:hypothetical protein
VGGQLARLIWFNNILQFENALLALADRDDDPNALPLVEHLLLANQEFGVRVDYFCSLNLNPEHWNETYHFVGHRHYHDKYPEKFGPPECVE